MLLMVVNVALAGKAMDSILKKGELVVGITGSVLGGLWAGMLMARQPDATLRLVLYGTVVLFVTAPVLTYTDSPWFGIVLLIPVTFCMAMPPGLIMATLQAISPNELRDVGLFSILQDGEVTNLKGTAQVARNIAVAIFGTQWREWLIPFLGGLE